MTDSEPAYIRALKSRELATNVTPYEPWVPETGAPSHILEVHGYILRAPNFMIISHPTTYRFSDSTKDNETTLLFISGFASHVSVSDIIAFCTHFGKVFRVRMIVDQKSMVGIGAAIVELESIDNARETVMELCNVSGISDLDIDWTSSSRVAVVLSISSSEPLMKGDPCWLEYGYPSEEVQTVIHSCFAKCATLKKNSIVPDTSTKFA